MSSERPARMIEQWRRLVLFLLLFGIVGVGLELILLEHYEDPWQWAPIALLGLGFAVGGLALLSSSQRLVRGLQVLMVAYVVAGGLGVWFHLKANVEFELELRPAMAGRELIVETLRGAMPALAPGAMVQLGLLGLLATWKHPSLRRAADGAIV